MSLKKILVILKNYKMYLIILYNIEYYIIYYV